MGSLRYKVMLYYCPVSPIKEELNEWIIKQIEKEIS